MFSFSSFHFFIFTSYLAKHLLHKLKKDKSLHTHPSLLKADCLVLPSDLYSK